MKRLYLSVLSLLTLIIVLPAQFTEYFETNNNNFSGFSGTTADIQSDPLHAGNNVLRISKGSTAQSGIVLLPGGYLNYNGSDSTIYFKFYGTQSCEIALSIENIYAYEKKSVTTNYSYNAQDGWVSVSMKVLNGINRSNNILVIQPDINFDNGQGTYWYIDSLAFDMGIENTAYSAADVTLNLEELGTALSNPEIQVKEESEDWTAATIHPQGTAVNYNEGNYQVRVYDQQTLVQDNLAFFVDGWDNSFSSVITTFNYPTTNTYNAYKVNQINIDGLIDSTWLFIDSIVLTQALRGMPQDLSSFKMAWNDEYLYLLLTVTDTEREINTLEPWNGDCASLFFDMDNVDVSTMDNITDKGVWMIKAMPNANFFDTLTRGNGYLSASEPYTSAYNWNTWESETRREINLTANGYIIEYAIPWSLLSDNFTPLNNEIFGFDITVSDDTLANNEHFRSHLIGWAQSFNLNESRTDLYNNIQLTDTNCVKDTTVVNIVKCYGQTYNGYSQTGTYYEIETNPYGCELVTQINLDIVNKDTTFLTHQICDGQEIKGKSTPGIYYFTETSTHGCDSIVKLELLGEDTLYLNKSICEGESYNGYTQNGTYIYTGISELGCDSIVKLNLTVQNIDTTTLSQEIFEGQTAYGITQPGVHYIKLVSELTGCDSVIKLNLTVNDIDTVIVNESICEGNQFKGENETGTYYFTYTDNQTGCDSIVQLNLTVNDIDTVIVNSTICQGGSVYGYNQTGTYFITESSRLSGCDSIVKLQLLVSKVDTTQIDTTVCPGTNVLGITEAGQHTITYKSGITGCDSLILLQIGHIKTDTSYASAEICQGQSYNGYTRTGKYYSYYTSYLGCDSVHQLNLQVNANPSLNLGNDTAIYYNSTLTLHAGNYISYLWNNDTRLSTYKVTNALGTGPKTIGVIVTDANGCKGSDEIRVTILTYNSIHQLPASSVMVYPNPSQGDINIQLSDISEDAVIRLVSQDGRVVYKNSISKNILNKNAQIIIQDIPTGVYHLNVFVGNYQLSKTIVVQ